MFSSLADLEELSVDERDSEPDRLPLRVSTKVVESVGEASFESVLDSVGTSVRVRVLKLSEELRSLDSDSEMVTVAVRSSEGDFVSESVAGSERLKVFLVS